MTDRSIRLERISSTLFEPHFDVGFFIVSIRKVSEKYRVSL